MRPRVLANSAVEFIETQPEKAFGQEVAERLEGQQPVQYVPQFDAFVPESDYPQFVFTLDYIGGLSPNDDRENYFKESQERSAQFQNTLSEFCKTLRKQHLDRTLGIQLKEPRLYTLKDVVEIAQKLQERKQQSESSSGYLTKIRKFFLRERGPLQSMLSFVPNDSYGSLISGGFAMILAVSASALYYLGNILTLVGCRSQRIALRRGSFCSSKHTEEASRHQDNAQGSSPIAQAQVRGRRDSSGNLCCP